MSAAEYRFADRGEAERWAAEHGIAGTVEVRTEGASIQGVDDYRPYVLVVPPAVPERTGYRGIDRILEQAEARGLLTEVDRKLGGFVVARVHNHGRAGANGLNDAQIVLYASFSRSKRGCFCGGHEFQTIGKQRTFAKTGRGLHDAGFWAGMMYLAPEYRRDEVTA